MARQGDRHQRCQAAPLGPETLNIQGLLFSFSFFFLDKNAVIAPF